MTSFAAIHEKVNQELENLRKQKSMLEAEVDRLSEFHHPQQLDQEFDKFFEKSNKSLQNLILNSQKIQKEVSDIGEISDKTLKSFEILKYRKSNVEKVLNTLTAILELNRILEPYSKAVETKNFEECIKYIRQYKNIENCINEDITPEDIRKFKEISTNLVTSLRSEFEKAIETNNNELINSISTIFFLLNIEEKTFEKVLSVYEKRLDESINKFIEKLDKEKETGTTFQSVKNYEFSFYHLFVDYLSVLARLIDTYKDNVVEHFELPGLLQMIDKIVNYKCELFLQQKFIPTIYNFYELNAPALKVMIDRIPIEQPLELSQWVSREGPQVGKYKELVNTLETFCEEASDISNQAELFKKHLSSMFTEDESELLRKAREHDKNPPQYYISKIENLQLNRSILELLDKFFNYQRFTLKFQIIHILQHSGFIRSAMTFEKSFFMDYVNMEEQIYDHAALFEYLDEIFYMMRTSAERALGTLDKSIACAFLQYLSNNIIMEDLYRINADIFTRYLKKDFFNPSMIYFTPNNNVYNTVIIVIFNNAERVLSYLKNLKETLMEQYTQLFGDEKESNMIFSSIEDLEGQNLKMFTNLLDEKFKILAEYLKTTIRNEIERIKDANFQFNESYMNEVEEKFKYSQTIKNKLAPAMNQWKKQLSKTNFERFISAFCENIAKTLEALIFTKKYHQLGAILLDKEIRSVITFLQGLTNINVKKNFSRLSHICEMLTLETQEEIEEVYQINVGELNAEDLKRIIKLRSDLRKGN